jgi:hypothetical protein
MSQFAKAACVLLALAVPLKANAKLYFCEMTEYVIIDVYGSIKLDNQRFTMKVGPSAVSLNSDGYFKNSRASIDLWRGHDEWSATTANDLKYVDTIYRFGDGVLNVSVVFQKQITSIRAVCEKDQ